MHEPFTGTHRSVLVVGFLSTLALLLTGAASTVRAVELDPGEAPPAARVTAHIGAATSGNDPLEKQATLGDGSDLETGEDGGCSVLVDDNVLMELCGRTSLRLERKDDKQEGVRVVRLDRGEIRLVVEPRLGLERIEIHTPAAIATILGTVVFISVDEFDITTITTGADSESVVSVTSNLDNVKGETQLTGGQQVVIHPGEAPPPAAKLNRQAVARLGGCLVNFHSLSLDLDLRVHRGGKIEAVVNEEMSTVSLAAVAAETTPDTVPQVDPPVDTDPPYTPTDVVDPDLIMELSRPGSGEPPCGSLPGKTC